MAFHSVRDWRGNKMQLSRCNHDELVGLLSQSIAARQQIALFIREIEAELAGRRESRSPSVAG